MLGNRKTATLAEVRQREFLGHPVGLWALFTTEMWERFCYYGMRALLVLYLISTLTGSNPGFGWSEKNANELYGWFTGLVYLFPLLGGYLADRFLGQHRSVLLGGSLMAVGEFCLFYSEYFRQGAITTITFQNAPAAFTCFMLGLFLITLGNGFFKPCISVMVGELYEKNDPRRDTAFYIFYMGINVGAFAAPFIAGTIGEKISWHWGFLTACIGMCFGLLTYSFFRPKYLGPIGGRFKASKAATTDAVENDDAGNIGTTPTPLPKSRSPLTRVEIDRIAVILTLTFFCIAFWSVFEQAGTSLNIFANKETNRQVPNAVGRNIPGFLPNQADLAVKIAKRDLETDLFELKEAVSAFEDDSEKVEEVEDLPSYLLEQTYAKNFETIENFLENNKEKLDPVELEEFASRLADVQESYESGVALKNRANVARERAGLEELAVDLENFENAVLSGEKENNDISTEVENQLPEKIDEAQKASQEINEDSLRESLRVDVIASRQNQFLVDEQKNIDKVTAIYTFPTTWYQSVNPLAVVVFAPLFGLLWGFLRRHGLEPSTPMKFGIGLIMLSLAFFFLIPGALQAAHTNGNAAAYWLLGTYLLCTFGELCLSPVGLSMVSRLAPERYASLLMGIWFLSSAIAGYLSGKLAAVFGSSGAGAGRVSFCFGEQGGLADFFLIMALVPLCAGLIVFLLVPKLRKMMHEEDEAQKA